MNSLPYINLGCGNKYHKEWVNIDLYSNSPYVKQWDLTKGIPYDENSFEAVYHSQVIEHYEREEAGRFLEECLRVLRPGGIIRIVTPDLEGIAREYLKYLEANIQNPTEMTNANYEWMLLELYDQAVRNAPGGGMSKFFQQRNIINEKFVFDRLGAVAKSTRQHYLDLMKKEGVGGIKNLLGELQSVPGRLLHGRRRIVSIIREKIADVLLSESEKESIAIGRFRRSGDIHYWLYDRYSLARLLRDKGFRDIERMDPRTSGIPDWDRYELDVIGGEVCDPGSLFMEARK